MGEEPRKAVRWGTCWGTCPYRAGLRPITGFRLLPTAITVAVRTTKPITAVAISASGIRSNGCLYLVVGPKVIAYLAFTAALTHLRSSSVATLALIEPVIAAALALLVVGEALGSLAVVEIVLVSVSLMVFSVNRGPELRDCAPHRGQTHGQRSGAHLFPTISRPTDLPCGRSPA